MTNMDKKGFQNACKNVLSPLPIGTLRNYARMVGVSQPTTKIKDVLIEETIAILCGDMEPTARSRRGKPVLDDRVDEKILQTIENYRLTYLSGGIREDEDFYAQSTMPPIDIQSALKKIRENKVMFVLEDPNGKALAHGADREIRTGQLQTLNQVSMLLPLNCIANDEKTVCSVDLIRKYNLREGDVITCYVATNRNINVVNRIVAINGVNADNYQRFSFDEADACEPYSPIQLMEDGCDCDTALKFFQWLAPLYHGQRACIFSAPKVGKTQLLAQLAQAIRVCNPKTKVLALLIDESPETVWQFRKIMIEGDLVYTTYEDEPERQVFVADYILKRAKRYVEMGKEVVLLVDSLSALAKAYNETNESSGGKTLSYGLESKTLHYLKKYLGSARCFEKGGALTVIGTVSCGTGNPVDDLISSELSLLANFQTTLRLDLAIKRYFPALDLSKTYSKTRWKTEETDKKELETFVRGQYLEKRDAESLLEVLDKSFTYAQFAENIQKDFQ